jgi:AraC-like DNA-binding protein
MGMRLKVFLPSKALAPYVEVYYLSSNLRQDDSAPRFPAISTSYIKLSSVSAVVSGQTTKPTVADSDFGALAGLGVKLRAGAFYALFGLPASELTNRVIRVDEVLGRTTTELIDQLAEEAGPAEQVRCLERILLRYVQRARQRDELIAQQLVAALRRLPAMPISKLAEELGYSVRQLQRKLNDVVGLSPRLYQRICRFEKTLDLIHASSEANKISWTTIALTCGYSDQAHFIRDFHEFAGCTPGRYLASSYVN